MISKEKALHLAHQWIVAWNSHQLDEIISHYAADIEFYSPFVVKLLHDATGKVSGIENLRSYFSKGLQANPDLNFELYQVLPGIESITLYYKSVKNLLAAEVMFLDTEGKICKVYCHYTDAQ